MAMRRLNARSFTSAAPLPASTPAAATGATVGATASASTKANVGTIARKKKKKQSTDQRFATVGLPLLLFVAGGYMALTQVCFAFSVAVSVISVWLCVSCCLLSNGFVCVCLNGASVQFVGGKFEARDHIIKSHTTREFDLEEEHKVRAY